MRVSDALGGARAGRWVPLYDPARDPVREFALRHRRSYRSLEAAVWFAAVAFDVADFVTTYLGVPHPGITEAVPASRWALLAFGWPGLLVAHALGLLLVVALWLCLPRPYRVAIPAVAVWTGYVIVRGNLDRLVAYGVLDLPW